MAVRSSAMAQIQANMQRAETTPVSAQMTDVAQPRPAANVDTPTVLTKEQKAAKREAEHDEDRARRLAKEERATLTNDQQRLEQERSQQETRVQGLASSALQQAGNIWRNTKVRLGDIPQPGSILLPLAILLLGFFILIPVNGHSRLVWLWLTLSGNAHIDLNSLPNDAGAAGGQDITTPGNTSTTQTETGNVTLPPGGSNLLLPFPTTLVFSGVQDVS